MPQMAPMWWTMIFSMTMCLMLMSMMFTYFLISKKVKIVKETKTNNFNWKW
uniref:ATP synthase F0 subunit 8 n=1 Tax=Paralaevicephalus gracilipenis TaxID=1513330 RepID=A0A6B9QFY7_9HEMI|nr:ATP synthase F0 subunit 8 [Paralaevicephalus gracilipenis]